MTRTRSTTTRSDRFLRSVADYADVVIVTHTNPDPDAIASGWGLAYLIKQKFDKNLRFVAGGAILRAENRRFMELLKPPIELVGEIDLQERPAIILADCNPTAGNHLLSDQSYTAAAVIDHHPPNGKKFRVRHRDIRPKVAATATIVCQYLREQDVEPPSSLATALLYAIHTDALGWPVFSRLDNRALSWLHHYADLNRLASIQSAPLPPEYYADLLLALESTFLYDDSVVCFLPQAAGPEIVGEVADLLLRGEGFNRVLCAGVINGDVLLSVRTTDNGGDAVRLANKVTAGIGHGGGHGHRAGGCIPASTRSSKISTDLQSELRSRWLDACGVDQGRGSRLVARREILEHL